jgi:cell division protein ZapE
MAKPNATDEVTGFDACLERLAAGRGVVLSDAQRLAAAELGRLHDDLLRAISPTGTDRLRRLLRPRPVRGLYLWGEVGRGKSFMMDAFFACLPGRYKQRSHLHHFMQEVHGRLAALKGQSDPLERVAGEIARHVRLLCLDEFQVTDITDAMLMRGLLQGLFDRGVALVVTSNAEPEALYRNGLQRGRFLPTIALIKERMTEIRFGGGRDFRLDALAQAGAYHTPLGESAEQALAAVFAQQAGSPGERGGQIEVERRLIAARALAEDVAWFDFDTLCRGPRSKSDYIALADRFRTVLLSGVPRFGPPQLAEARRFLWLVDEFYDRRIRLIISAAAPLAELGQAGLLDGEFARTLSRLAEMQSSAYLSGAGAAPF